MFTALSGQESQTEKHSQQRGNILREDSGHCTEKEKVLAGIESQAFTCLTPVSCAQLVLSFLFLVSLTFIKGDQKFHHYI